GSSSLYNISVVWNRRPAPNVQTGMGSKNAIFLDQSLYLFPNSYSLACYHYMRGGRFGSLADHVDVELNEVSSWHTLAIVVEYSLDILQYRREGFLVGISQVPVLHASFPCFASGRPGMILGSRPLGAAKR